MVREILCSSFFSARAPDESLRRENLERELLHVLPAIIPVVVGEQLPRVLPFEPVGERLELAPQRLELLGLRLRLRPRRRGAARRGTSNSLLSGKTGYCYAGSPAFPSRGTTWFPGAAPFACYTLVRFAGR